MAGLLRSAVAGLALAVAGAAGCQTPPPTLPGPPSEALRASFGTVGIAPVEPALRVSVVPPMAGSGKGLAFGFARGVVMAPVWTAAGVGYGGSGHIPGAIIGGMVGAAIAVVYVPLSTAAGAGTIESPKRIDAARPTIALILENFDLPGRLRRATVAAADRNAGRPLHELESWNALGVDTRIVLVVEAIHGKSQSPWTLLDLNARFPIRVRVHARLVRVIDDRVLHEMWIEYSNEFDTRTYVEWGADGGRALRTTLERAADALGARLVDYWFLLTEERWWRTNADAGTAGKAGP